MGHANSPVSPGAIVRSLPRAWDDLPIWAQLNVTWRCNLDCSYCTEYDNTKGHVAFEDLTARVDKIHELGTLHCDLIGGEPVLHPDLARVMRHVTARGMTTGMTTNGFLLTEDKLRELIDAGMGRLQMSVDAARPRPGFPKSLKTLRGKIEMVARHDLWFRINTVVCNETVDDVEEVANFCFDLGVPVNFSVVHDRGRLVRRDVPRVLERVRWLRARKQEGRPVSTPYFLIDYFERALADDPIDWVCQAGSKSFYVSPEGDFQFCHHVPPRRKLSAVTREEMAGYRGRKGCETDCGVHCVIQTSLPFSNPGGVVKLELRRRASALLPVLRD